MQSGKEMKQRHRIAAYQILIQQFTIERLKLMIEQLLIKRTTSSPVEGLLNVAEDQGTYQALIERLIDRIMQAAPQSAEELLRMTVQEMGVRAYGVISAERSHKRLKVEAEWPRDSIDWNILEEDLLNCLTTGKNRSELMSISEELGSRNLLLSRLDARPDGPDWLHALVFVGRKQPPVKDASLGFLTRDFPIIERVADFYREEKAGIEKIPAVQQPLWQATSLRNILVDHLGPRVTLTIGDGELVVSGITPQKELRDLATQAMAEICIIPLVGWHIFEQVSLEKGVSLTTARGTVDEFGIVVRGLPVYGRRISVRQLPGGSEAEVVLPIGWWWHLEPQEPFISDKEAADIALEEEKSKQPEAPDLETHLVKTVLWPDEPPGRVAHEVQITSERGLSATYFINAYDGSIITRRQTIRM